MGFYAKKLIRRVEDKVKYVEDLGMRKQIQGKKMMRSLARKLVGQCKHSPSQYDMVHQDMSPAPVFVEKNILKINLVNLRVDP